MNKELYEHYKAILKAEEAEAEDLKAERERIDGRLEQTQASIARISAKISDYHEATPAGGSEPVQVPERLKYAGMSVRWAILRLMADGGAEDLSTSQMAETLKNGGVSSGGKNFAGNVSAVVSEMVRVKRELESPASGIYRITALGREKWDTIRHSAKYRFGRIAVAAGAAGGPATDDGDTR